MSLPSGSQTTTLILSLSLVQLSGKFLSGAA
jgi:hypothetical protein